VGHISSGCPAIKTLPEATAGAPEEIQFLMTLLSFVVPAFDPVVIGRLNFLGRRSLSGLVGRGQSKS